MKTLMFFVILMVMLPQGSVFRGDSSIKVKPGGTLNISLNTSDITINVWTKSEVQVNADEENFNLRSNGNNVYLENRHGYINSFIVVNIPVNFNLNIQLSAGDIKLNGDLKGDFNVTNSGGEIRFNNINGKVNITTGGGNIHGNDISGNGIITSSGGDIIAGVIKGRVSIQTGGGNIKINTVPNVDKISTTGGNIMLRRASGNGDIETGGGNIDINSSDGNLSVASTGGDIRINDAGGNLNVISGGGVIRIKSLKGSMKAKNESGDMLINLSSQTRQSEFRTTNGNIRVSVDGGLRAVLYARYFDPEWWKEDTGSDNLRSDFKVTSLKRNKNKQMVEAVYELNGGGPKILLESNHGEIVIKRN